MDSLLKKKTSQFLKITGMSMGYMGKHVDLSVTSISGWLGDKRELSENAKERIIQFMTERTMQLVELAK